MRTAIAAALAAAAWLAAGYLLAPWLLERAIVRYDASGPARAMAVERVTFNPFTLEAAFHGFELAEADVSLTAARVRANLSVTSVLRWALVLDRLTLDGARLAVARVDAGSDSRARLAEAVAARAAALPDLTVAELDMPDAELSLTEPAEDGGDELFVARTSLAAADLANTAGRLAIGAFELRADEADAVSLELSGRLARDPTVVSGNFRVAALEIERLAERLVPDLAAREPNGVLDARGQYTLSGGGTFRTLQLSAAAAEIDDTSWRTAEGGAVSIRRLEAELEAEIDLAARRTRATGRLVLASPTLSTAGGEPAVLGAERIAADDVALTLPGPALHAARARVEGWRARADLAARAPRLPAEWALTVDDVELTNGSLGLVDTSTAPAVELGVEQARGRLVGVGAGGLPRELEIDGDLGGTDGGTLELRLRRSGPSRYDRADLAIAGLPARALSPYAEHLAGWRLEAGDVDLTLSWRDNGRAAGFSDWTVDGLALATAPGRAAEADPASGPGPSGPDATDSGAARLPLAFAAALATGADERLEISVPLGAGPAVAQDRAAPYLPGIAGAALARHVTESAAAPFTVLARLVDADADALRAVPFAPGSAELSSTADARLAAAARALAERPRLTVGPGAAYAPAVDREALAAEQVRVHIALATAEAARSEPTGPLDFTSLRVQDVLDEFAGQRLAPGVRESLAARFDFSREAAPSERVPYYEAVYAALAENEPITEQMTNRLARYRALAVADALERHGIDAARLLTPGAAGAVEVGAANDVLVPLVLGTLP